MKIEKLRDYFRTGVVQVVNTTPFKKNEEIDYEGLKENISFLIGKRQYGPMVLTPVGSNGEQYALTDEEWAKIVKMSIDAVNGKVPVVPGASHSGTKVAIERAKIAEDYGADGVLVVLPYYHVPEEEGLYLHYKKIADSIDIGVVPYNNADVSKIYMKPHVLKKLVENTYNIVALKENTPYIPTLYEQIKTIGDKVPVLQGRGDWWFCATAFLGVRGYITSKASYMPEFCLDLLKAGLNGDYRKLKDFMRKLDPLEEFVAKMSKKYGPSTTILSYPWASSYMGFAVTKSSMDILGLSGGYMRLPLLNLKDEDKEELKKILFEKLQLSKIK